MQDRRGNGSRHSQWDPMKPKIVVNRNSGFRLIVSAVRDAQLASGSEWICADDICKMLPNMDGNVVRNALQSAASTGILLSNGSSYAVKTALNPSEQRAYSETLKACQKLRRPVAISEIETVDRPSLARQMSRLVYKGFLRKTNNRYTPTRQEHTRLATPSVDTKRPRRKAVTKARSKASQGAALVVTAQQDSPSLSARFRALAAALLALFVRP